MCEAHRNSFEALAFVQLVLERISISLLEQAVMKEFHMKIHLWW
jgi:hypothetical protein